MLVFIISVLQQNRLLWYGHVLWKEDNDWMKKCMEYEVHGSWPRGRPKRTWREVVEKDCQARKSNKEDAMDRNRWRKFIKDVWWSGWVWVGECFFWYRPTRVVQDKGLLNGCVCVCWCSEVTNCYFSQDSVFFSYILFPIFTIVSIINFHISFFVFYTIKKYLTTKQMVKAILRKKRKFIKRKQKQLIQLIVFLHNVLLV